MAHHHLKGLFAAKLLDSRSISRLIHIFHGLQYGKRFWICSSLRWCKKTAMTMECQATYQTVYTHSMKMFEQKLQKHFYSYNVIYYKWILRDIIFWVSMYPVRVIILHDFKKSTYLQFIINLAKWNRISPTWICLIFGVGGPRSCEVADKFDAQIWKTLKKPMLKGPELSSSVETFHNLPP